MDMEDEKPRVLAVDQEASMLKFYQLVLGLEGISCQGYTDPEKALAAFASDPDGIDLLLAESDPNYFDGLELARRARKISPSLPVVIATRYYIEEISRGPYSQTVALLQMPTDNRTLVNTIITAYQRSL